MKINSICFVALLFIVSCSPDPIDLVVPQSEPKPVISSQYVAGGMLAITVSRSFDAVTNPNLSVDSNGLKIDERLLYSNAEIWLNNEKLEQAERGLYVLQNRFLQDNIPYTIEVKQDGKTIALATETKQSAVLFDSVTAYRGAAKSLNIYYRINEPGTHQYFVVNYFTKKTKDSIPTNPDANYIAKRMLEQNAGYDLFTAADFKNGPYVVSKTVSSNYESDTLMIGLSGVSAGYYKFLEAQKKAGSLFNQMRGEVINFPSNVKGGYGYFQLAEPDLRILEVE